MITHDAKNIKCVQKQWLTSINDNITFSVTEKKKTHKKHPGILNTTTTRTTVICVVVQYFVL